MVFHSSQVTFAGTAQMQTLYYVMLLRSTASVVNFIGVFVIDDIKPWTRKISGAMNY